MLVGLIGFKNAGKTQITKALAEWFPVNMIGFSNPLYDMLGVLGITHADIQDKSKREVPNEKLMGRSIQYALNTLGTGWGRKMIHEDIWATKALESQKPDVTFNVADNVRFPNEFRAVRKAGGVLIGISNPLVSDDGTEPEKHVLSLQAMADEMIVNDPRVNSIQEAASGLFRAIQRASLKRSSIHDVETTEPGGFS